jgi:hypothetical protein
MEIDTDRIDEAVLALKRKVGHLPAFLEGPSQVNPLLTKGTSQSTFISNTVGLRSKAATSIQAHCVRQAPVTELR